MSEHEEFMSPASLSSANDHIDKLTLELLLNKNHYSKYLSKTDPEKYEKHKEYKAKLRKYSVDIIDITSRLIENPKEGISADIEEGFNIYMKLLIRYFEMKELDNINEHGNNAEEADEDMLFGAIDEEPKELSASKSFWGKDRVLKKEKDINAFTMEMFSKPRR
jgi:hypothetical protein